VTLSSHVYKILCNLELVYKRRYFGVKALKDQGFQEKNRNEIFFDAKVLENIMRTISQ
jgi:hypothetical protein